MTLDNLLKKTLTSSTLALSLLAATTCSSEDPAEQPEWPADCRIKNYTEECFCEDMSGTYSVHKGGDCNPLYTEISIEQFPQETVGPYANCYENPACSITIIGTNIKTGEKSALNCRSNFFLNSAVIGNQVKETNITNDELVQCDKDYIKLYSNNRECSFWLKRTSSVPAMKEGIDYGYCDFDKGELK
ncbi:MAG: hypothetical protein ABH824_07505 [Nanoarchaeota archaeon]|nr:hypothetical protein [Nanoarchaeota archaeon]MBU1632618.1 hypothetical protein [Nanoarchaeota archaeon]MBU1876447.1 hypothetical protein [Nanoarchaeota archaeon]